jgi:hypothetical protein
MQKEAMGARSSGGGGGGTSSGRASGGAKQDKPNAKQASTARDIKMYRDILNDDINQLSGLIQQYGTKEITGEQQKVMEMLKDNIAMNLNKMKDPTSVTSINEIENVKRMMGSPGFMTKTDTALKELAGFKNAINREADTRVRYLEPSSDNASMPQQSNVLQSAPQGMVEVLDASGNTRAIPREALSEMPKGWRKK